MLEGIYYVGKIPQIFRVFSKWAWSTTPFRGPKIAKKNIGQIDSEFHETNNVLIFRQLLNISPSTFFARNLEKFREENGNLFCYVHIVLLFRYWCRCGHSEYRQIFEGIFYVGQIPQCGTDPAILRAFSSRSISKLYYNIFKVVVGACIV